MTQFHVYTGFARPGLHVWRAGTDTRVWLRPVAAASPAGWFAFDYDLEPGIAAAVRFLLFAFDDAGKPGAFEADDHQRELPRAADGSFPAEVWCVQGSARVLDHDPRRDARATTRLHVISRRRYRPAELFIWDARSWGGRRIGASGEDAEGPYFDVTLADGERSFFSFKFVGRAEDGQTFAAFEPDLANRVWTARDGGEVWTHSGAPQLLTALPARRNLIVHCRHEIANPGPTLMRLWQRDSDYIDDAVGSAEGVGRTRHEAALYPGLPYRLLFWNPELPEPVRWEDREAEREVTIAGDTEYWTLEGDRALFPAPPRRDRRVDLTIVGGPPTSRLDGALFAHVWINRARGPLHESVAAANGVASFTTYPGVVTSVKLRDEHGRWEGIARHALVAPDGARATRRFLVPERPPLLVSRPPAGHFADPPFPIRRPGAYEEAGELRFVVHAPGAARLRLVGAWTGWEADPLELRSTRDGTYWWASVPRVRVLAGLGAATYHGAQYQLLLNDDERLQGPAAGWMDSSWNRGRSRLVQSDAYAWGDLGWRRPGREYLVVYQLHAGRFSNRFPDDPPLVRVAREVEANAGYLRDLGVTALLLLPLNEVGSRNSWGYDPAFFYAIEHDLGGPDALKRLVDTCHRHGLAVILDVVFNHAGAIDNILWSVARDSYFDGDTSWGAMINFDHPQCRHFFAQNLAYLAREYHLDGFRLDHTHTIVHADERGSFVREPGSGGGWDFLHGLRHTLHDQVEPRCLLMAEHLPNEWALTNRGGPMDTQWCDDFHDRLVDACRGGAVMPRLADALKRGHTDCDDWSAVTNYPESHDEVGNVRDRIAYVAGWKRGRRMAKVAAAATLLSRGIPLYFMGAESAEDRQFTFGGAETLDLDGYFGDEDRGRVRAWWRELTRQRRSPIQGPAPLTVHFAEGQLLAFARGDRGDYFVVLNFGGWAGWRSLGELHLGDGTYRERWNSTWPAFAVAGEDEDEHTNGGRAARLTRGDWLHIPDYGAVVLERLD